MTTITRYARYIEIISVVLMPLSLFLLIFKWTYGIFLAGDPRNFWLTYEMGDSITFSLDSMPLLARIAGVLIDGVSVAIFLTGFYYIIHIMRRFRQGEVFSFQTLSLFKTISKLALVNALFCPLRVTLLTLITTLHNPPGQRYLAVSIGTEDVINIVIFGFFLVITSVMYEGYRLQIEHDLTV